MTAISSTKLHANEPTIRSSDIDGQPFTAGMYIRPTPTRTGDGRPRLWTMKRRLTPARTVNLSSVNFILLTSLLLSQSLAGAGDRERIFALVPKETSNPFFDFVNDGCQQRASEIPGVSCMYVGPTASEDAEAQADIIDALIARGDIDGISMSVINATVATEAIARAVRAGIPVVTFDSDAEDSLRTAFIGTDNSAFGVELGKILAQLDPMGGKYGMIAAGAPNLMARVDGVRDRLADTKWDEVSYSPKYCMDSTDIALEQMWEFAADPEINAIVPVGGWPMFDTNTTRWESFVNANSNLTLVVGDTLPVQFELMNKGYVNGLVGQLPFQMGEMSVDALLKITLGGTMSDETIYGTALLEVLRFPLILPDVVVDMNYIGSLAILGYVCFAIMAILSIGFAAWTFANRNTRVIRASQPPFLGMICFGVLIMASTIIPLTVDDEKYSQRGNDIACMATPWLLFTGFSTTFAALFSKTWRVNKIFHNPSRFSRIKVEAKDVMGPYVGLMAVNVIVLACWTAIAPLVFRRMSHAGTDDWNRVISSYGMCTSVSDAKGGYVPYFLILGVVNLGVLVLANVQAYQARAIRTEFSESKYIAIIMASMLQACIIAIPIVFLVWDQPQVMFVVLTCLLFVVCMAVLLLMFVPKLRFLNDQQRDEKEKRAAMVERRGGHDSDDHSDLSLPNSSDTDDGGRGGLKIAIMTSTTMAMGILLHNKKRAPAIKKEEHGAAIEEMHQEED